MTAARSSLCELFDPAVLADPYPLYHRLRAQDPVMWDPILHAWVVTSYAECVAVFRTFSAVRTPNSAQLGGAGVDGMEAIAATIARQMLFMDAPAHTKLRGLCAAAFTPRRVERLAERIERICDALIDRRIAHGQMDVIADFAAPLPAIVTAELLGLPVEDHPLLKDWSADFAEFLGNFQQDPGRARKVGATFPAMVAYFEAALDAHRRAPRDGLIGALLRAEVDGERLRDDEIVANLILTMVGGQETTTNLIASGLLTLLHQPDRLAELTAQPDILTDAVEELLRFESPSQHTARLAPADCRLGDKTLKARDPVIAVMAAANRDPLRFAEPDRLDLRRRDNRHLAFGWASHFCFGAPLARLEARIAFATLLRRLQRLRLVTTAPVWRENVALRGLVRLDVGFEATAA